MDVERAPVRFGVRCDCYALDASQERHKSTPKKRSCKVRNANVSDEISLIQFHKLIISFYYAVSENRSIFTPLHILLLEPLILCRLVMG